MYFYNITKHDINKNQNLLCFSHIFAHKMGVRQVSVNVVQMMLNIAANLK